MSERGEPWAPPRSFRLALEVAEAEASTAQALDAGAELIAPPTETPWRSLNARLDAPGGVQLTLFQELEG